MEVGPLNAVKRRQFMLHSILYFIFLQTRSSIRQIACRHELKIRMNQSTTKNTCVTCLYETVAASAPEILQMVAPSKPVDASAPAIMLLAPPSVLLHFQPTILTSQGNHSNRSLLTIAPHVQTIASPWFFAHKVAYY